MYKYKNKTEDDLTLVGIGQIKAGQVFETNVAIENSNLELLSDAAPAPAPAAEVPSETQTKTEEETI